MKEQRNGIERRKEIRASAPFRRKAARRSGSEWTTSAHFRVQAEELIKRVKLEAYQDCIYVCTTEVTRKEVVTKIQCLIDQLNK